MTAPDRRAQLADGISGRQETGATQDALRTEVRAALTVAGISQASAARRLGLSQKHLSQMLTGRATLTIGWADRILALCGLRLHVSTVQSDAPAGDPMTQPQTEADLPAPAAAAPTQPDITPQAGQPEYIEVGSYRTDAGHTAWVMRCWGDGTCDGLISLDHDTERWAVVARDRHLSEAHNVTTPQAGQPQADGPLVLDRAAADALRERYAAAMLEHYITDEADVDGNCFCSCTEWGEGPDEHWDYHLADVFLAVRDDEVARLRAELADLRAQAAELRETNRRLNYRCQNAEHVAAVFKRAVDDWEWTDRGTYVPLRSLTAIAKAAGLEFDGSRLENHIQRVERLQAELDDRNAPAAAAPAVGSYRTESITETVRGGRRLRTPPDSPAAGSESADGPLLLDRAAATVMRDFLNQLLGDEPADDTEEAGL